MRAFYCFNNSVKYSAIAALLLLLAASNPSQAASPAPDAVPPAPADTAPAAAADTAPAPKETCKEIIERVRKSDCAKPVARFMDGASVVLGLAFNSSEMDITSDDTALASMVGILSPSPYFSFVGPKSFFGKSRWGYEFALSYTSSIAIYQNLSVDGEQVKDLGTYATITFLSVSPAVFFSIGARDEDPDIFWRYGLGLGGGWASVRGVAFHTQDPGGTRGACHDAAERLKSGDISKAGLRDACDLENFHDSGLGFASVAFTDFRWGFFYGKFSAGGMLLDADLYEFHPLDISIKFAYMHDI